MPEMSRTGASGRRSASQRVVESDALLAAAVLDGAGPSEIARRFGELSGWRVALLTPDLSVSYSRDRLEDVEHQLQREVAQKVTAAGKAGAVVTIGPTPGWSNGRSHVAPVIAAGEVLGFLVMYERVGHTVDRTLAVSSLQHAATLCAIAIQDERRRNDLVNELRYDLVAGLLVRDQSAQADRSRWSDSLGLVTGTPYRVLCADTRPATNPMTTAPYSGGTRVLDALAREISLRSPNSISVVKGNELLSLIPEVPQKDGHESSARAVAREAINRILALFPSVDLAAGLGRAGCPPTSLIGSGLEARNSLLVQRRFSPSVGLLSFEELGVYSLLYQVADTAELQAFVDRVLGGLILYDQKRHAALLRTLRAILEHNGSLLNAARDLGVHVNTIAYRNERIKSITGLDLSRCDDRLMSYLAFKIIDGLPRDGHSQGERRSRNSSTLSDRLRGLRLVRPPYQSQRSASTMS